MKRLSPLIVPMCLLAAQQGCSSGDASRSTYVGTWEYDRESLRGEALASAIESVSTGGSGSLSETERAEVEAWVNENHDAWDKSIVIEDGGTYRAISRVGAGRAETIRGTWEVAEGEASFVESNGSVMATGRVVDGQLVLSVREGDREAEMIMLPAASPGG